MYLHALLQYATKLQLYTSENEYQISSTSKRRPQIRKQNKISKGFLAVFSELFVIPLSRSITSNMCLNDEHASAKRGIVLGAVPLSIKIQVNNPWKAPSSNKPFISFEINRKICSFI